MRAPRYLLLAGALLLAQANTVPAALPAQAQAQNCVRIAGTESSGEKNSLDPALQPSSQNSLMVNQVYNRLTDRDDNFQVKPELAESWESNADATEWTFHLRKGVKFHDGRDFTSADVVYTFKRLLDPATGSEGLAVLSFLDPNGITAPDPYTVVFKLPKPVSELPVLITNKTTFIVPNGASTEDIRTKGIGTGPFMAVDFKPVQQSWKFVKNPNYWEPGLPKADCLEFFVIQEGTTRNAALQSGQIDIAQGVDFSTIPVLQQDKNIKLLTTGASTSMTFSMWVDTPPFDNLKVRQALKKVIDRQKMVDTVFLGYATVGDDNPIPPTSPFAWRKEVPGPDIEGAKKLLAEAGYGPNNPLKIDLYTAEYLPNAVSAAQLFKEMAAEAGIEINVIVGPASEHWDNVWLKQPFVGSGWSARPPGEALAIAYRSSTPNPNNETHWKRPDYDALLDQANTTVDPEKRAELYKKAEQMLTEEGGAIIPIFLHTVAAMRANCEGYQPRVEIVRADFRTVFCTR